MDLTIMLVAIGGALVGAGLFYLGVRVGRKSAPTMSTTFGAPFVPPQVLHPVAHVPQLAHQPMADGTPRYRVGWTDDAGLDHNAPGYVGDDSDRAYTAFMELNHQPEKYPGRFYWDGTVRRFPSMHPPIVDEVARAAAVGETPL